MKLLLPLAVSFLFAAGIRPDIPATYAAEESEHIPEPEKKMVGEWLGFMVRKDIPVFLTRNRYCFLDSGTWEIVGDAADAKTEPQGWYKIDRDDDKLFLQPRDASEKEEQAAIRADLRDETTFVIEDPMDKGVSLTFLKKSSLVFPSADNLAGKWKITQMDPESGEKRDAPYFLVLKKDGSYCVEQPGKKLPEEWAQGTFEVDGLMVRIRNRFQGEGLWKSPSFFLLDGKLRYNDRQACLWCEKVNAEDGGARKEQPPEKKSGPKAAGAGKTEYPPAPEKKD